MEKQVISASRRTDLPRWYLQPTIDAFKRGFITLKNPFNAQQEYTIFLQPDKVSCIVWWSKDYSEWLKKKHELREYKHFFQFTLNGYSDPILQQLLERGVTTPFADRVKQLKALADIYSPLAINWRFDPIVYWLQDGQLRDNTGDFETILKVASDVGITRCTIAFCDWTYKKAIKRANHRHPNLTFFRPEPDILKREAISMGKMAQQYGVKLYSCADHTYVDNHYVYPSSCIDADLLVELFGDEISHIKDPSQREMCGCTKSRDIGAYTQGCPHSCVYCVSKDTEILMADLSVKKIKDVEIGDQIIGITNSINSRYHHITTATILNKFNSQKEAYKITLANGTELICSSDHRWLTRRGWKYVTNNRGFQYSRPYLTIGCRISQIYKPNQNYLITNDYKNGYLSGIIKGDGLLKKYDYSGKRRNKDVQYQFRLALNDNEATIRSQIYLADNHITTNNFIFTEKMNGIRTNSEESFQQITQLITLKLISDEFLRGFVAGAFDAEGHTDKEYGIISFTNYDDEYLKTVERGLKKYNFQYIRVDTSGKDASVTRVVGDRSDRIRFFQIFDPAIRRKRFYGGTSLKSNLESEIISIESLGIMMDMIDITTTTENFIANGCVSHNCYANATE